jgi:hypothetical protein
MMQHYFRNVNYALIEMAEDILEQGDKGPSRNGPVISYPHPVTITTMNPMERVLLCPKRRANPFLNLLDGLSILSSVRDVKPLSDIVPRFLNYSDDGVTLRAHYGARLRDQVHTAVHMLRQDPSSRRVVMTIWDKNKDLEARSVDIPCNVMVIPRIVRGESLDLTVINRSNDMFWGLLGANIVQFSFLQEYMARMLGVRVGHLHQFSTNLHAYTEFGPGRIYRNIDSIDDEKWENPFHRTIGDYPTIAPLDLHELMPTLDDLFRTLAEGEIPKVGPNMFINSVVLPMLQSWRERNLECLNDYPDCDWFVAARMWWLGKKR